MKTNNLSNDITLTKFSIKKYRSCIDTKIDLQSPLNILIGANGSGKTNILHAILLLKKLFSHFGWGRDQQTAIQQCQLNAKFSIDHMPLDLKVNIGFSTDEQNRDRVELVEAYYKTKDDRKWEIVPPIPLLIDLQRIPVSHHADYIYGSHPRYKAMWKKGYKTDLKNIPIFKSLSNYCSSFSYYATTRFADPHQCRSSFEIDEKGDLRRAYQSSDAYLQLMFEFYKNCLHETSIWSQFCDIIGPSGLGLVDKISFKTVKLPQSRLEIHSGTQYKKQKTQTTVVVPICRIKGVNLSFSQLSDGTLRTLGLVFSLITEDCSLLMIEEPEAFVHHGLMVSLFQLIRQYGQQRQTIVTTHSTDVLDLVDPSELFLVKQKDKHFDTSINHVPKLLGAQPLKALRTFLTNEGTLGDYWRSGGLSDL